MRRGITPVVAIALLLGMTVAASGGAYTFISQAQQSAQEDASTALAAGMAVRDLRCEDATVEATLKNTGDTSFTDSALDAYLYRDGTLVATSEVDVSSADVLQPNGLTTVSLPFVLDPGVRYTIEVRFPDSDVSAEQPCRARLSSLIGHWDFETKTPGTVRDAARGSDGTFENNDRDGTLQNVAFNATDGWTDGKIGSHALAYAGNSDVEVSGWTFYGEYTLAAWIRPGFTIADGAKHHVFNWVPGGATYVQLLKHSLDRWYIENKILNDYTQANVDDTSLRDEWHHYAATLNSSTVTIYLDGVPQDSSPVSTQHTGDNTSTLEIGNNNWNGRIDDARIYNRSLPAAEISALYGGSDIRDGIMGEWTFDEGNGTVAHDTSKWVDGQVGDYALAFDGTNEEADIGDVPAFDFGTADFSVFAWVNQDTQTDGCPQPSIVSKGYGGDAGQWTLSVRDQYLKFYADGESSTSGITLSPGTWHHVGVVRDGSDLEFYRGGVHEETDTGFFTGKTIDSAKAFQIGRNDDGCSMPFDGAIDDVRVYGTALSPDQVAALHGATD